MGKKFLPSFQGLFDELAEKVLKGTPQVIDIVTQNGQVTLSTGKAKVTGLDDTLEAFNVVVAAVIDSKRPKGVEFAFNIINLDELDMDAISGGENPDCTIKLQISTDTIEA